MTPLRRAKTGLIVGVCLTAALLSPTEAVAQRGRAVPVGRSRTAVVVNAGVYRPFYYRPYVYPYYYSPFWFGFGAYYDAFYAGWAPFYAQYPVYPSPYPGYYYGSAWASARVAVQPRDAQVYLDGYYVGIVRQFDGFFHRLDVPSGEHDLAVYLPGFRTYHERTLFRPGKSYHFKGVLEPLPAGAPAEPKPQPEPRAAQPTGQPTGPYPPGAYPPRAYPPGAYPREPRDPNEPYRPDPNGPPPIPPAPPMRGGAAEFGTLNIRVQPADATVIIDGERWESPEGGSRLSVQLPAGPHRVEVRKEGFRPYSSAVQIRPGEAQALNIVLPPGI